MYIQGDLCFILTEQQLENRNVIEDKVLARGTVTGHAHAAVNGEVFRANDTLYVEAFYGCRIVHDEHAEIELPQGIYEVRRQRVWQPNGWRTEED